MFTQVRVRRLSPSATAEWVIGWILLVLILGAAVVAAVYSILDYDRIGDDYSAILEAIEAVQEGVTSLLSSIVTVLADLALLLTKVDAIEASCSNVTVAGQCIPIYGAGMVLQDACYYFANSMPCDFVDAPCFVVQGSVEVDMRGQTLDIVSAGSSGFYMFGAADFSLSNGAITGLNYALPTAIDTTGIELWNSVNVWIDDVRMSELANPIFVAFSSGVFVTHSTVSNVTGTVYAVAFLGSSDVHLSESSFVGLNAPGSDVAGLAFHGVTDLQMTGLSVSDCDFVDSTLRFGTESDTELFSGFSVLDSRFSITDPTFAGSWLEIGALYCLSGANCSTPAAGIVRGNAFANTDAAPGFDGVIVERVDGLLFEDNALTANPTGFAPDAGVVNTALLHVCMQNTYVGSDFVGTGTCTGVTARRNEFSGIVAGSAVRATNGIIFEGGTDGALAEYNQLTGFGTGQPSNSSYPTCLTVQNAVSFAVVATTSVSNTGASPVYGDVGGVTVTGFPPGMITTGALEVDTPAYRSAAGSMDALYACLNALPCDFSIVRFLGGQELGPGVYCLGPGILTGTLTLNMLDPESVFVFQVAGSLTVSDSSVVNTIGSTFCNVFWAVSGTASFGASAAFIGNVLASGSITVGTGASLLGRLFSETGSISLADSIVQGVGCRATLPPAYPAQTPAAIWVRGGAQYVHLFANSIKDVACEQPGLIPGDGILVNGYEILASWAPPGSGLVDFQEAWGNSVQANQVSGVCSGCGIAMHGDESNYWHNEVHANNCSYVSGAGCSGIVLCYGQSEVAGWVCFFSSRNLTALILDRISMATVRSLFAYKRAHLPSRRSRCRIDTVSCGRRSTR